MRRVQHSHNRTYTVCRRRSRITNGGVVGVEEFPNGVNVVRDIKILDGEFLTLKGSPVRWRAGRTCDANAVIVAEFDAAEEALGKRLSGQAREAFFGPPICDVLADSQLIPARRIYRVHTCTMISE